MRLLITLFLLSFHFASAQDSLTVKEIHDAISKGFKPGYSIFIPKTNNKDIQSLWKKQLKNDGNTEITEKKTELQLAKTIVSGICSDSIVVISKVIQSTASVPGTNLSVFVIAGDTSFITSNSAPAIDGAIKSYMRSFAVNQYRNAVVNELNAEQKKLNVMKEELKRMERENENCIKRINSDKYNIARLQEQITANDELLETKSGEVDQQSETVKDLSDSDQKMDEEKKLKQMQKEKSKLLDEIASLKKDIDKNNSQIEDLQKKFDLNTSTNIPAKKEEIENQKEVVSNLSRTLNNIR